MIFSEKWNIFNEFLIMLKWIFKIENGNVLKYEYDKKFIMQKWLLLYVQFDYVINFGDEMG